MRSFLAYVLLSFLMVFGLKAQEQKFFGFDGIEALEVSAEVSVTFLSKGDKAGIQLVSTKGTEDKVDFSRTDSLLVVSLKGALGEYERLSIIVFLPEVSYVKLYGIKSFSCKGVIKGMSLDFDIDAKGDLNFNLKANALNLRANTEGSIVLEGYSAETKLTLISCKGLEMKGFEVDKLWLVNKSKNNVLNCSANEMADLENHENSIINFSGNGTIERAVNHGKGRINILD
jgi:hypothetical protein